MKKIIGFCGLFLSASLSAGVYIVPQSYDNISNAAKSSAYGVIKQATSQLSSNSYTIGGQSVKYRCLVVPKIKCTAATAEISANISESSLKEPGTESLVTTFQTDLRIEDDAINWYVCSAGYGGQVWDDSKLESTVVAGNTQLKYTYKPNSKAIEYFYFTNKSNSSADSFIAISYSQSCK